MVLNIDLYNLDHLAKNNLKRICPQKKKPTKAGRQ